MIEPIVILNEELIWSDSRELMGGRWSGGASPASPRLGFLAAGRVALSDGGPTGLSESAQES